MKAQSAYTRSMLDAIPPRAALAAKISAFTGSFGFTQNYASWRQSKCFTWNACPARTTSISSSETTGHAGASSSTSQRCAQRERNTTAPSTTSSPRRMAQKVAAGMLGGAVPEAASLLVYDARERQTDSAAH